MQHQTLNKLSPQHLAVMIYSTQPLTQSKVKKQSKARTS